MGCAQPASLRVRAATFHTPGLSMPAVQFLAPAGPACHEERDGAGVTDAGLEWRLVEIRGEAIAGADSSDPNLDQMTRRVESWRASDQDRPARCRPRRTNVLVTMDGGASLSDLHRVLCALRDGPGRSVDLYLLVGRTSPSEFQPESGSERFSTPPIRLRAMLLEGNVWAMLDVDAPEPREIVAAPLEQAVDRALVGAEVIVDAPSDGPLSAVVAAAGALSVRNAIPRLTLGAARPTSAAAPPVTEEIVLDEQAWLRVVEVSAADADTRLVRLGPATRPIGVGDNSP